jgi:hypothetical protein
LSNLEKNLPNSRHKLERNIRRYSGLGLLAVALMFALVTRCSPIESCPITSSNFPQPTPYTESERGRDPIYVNTVAPSAVRAVETQVAVFEQNLKAFQEDNESWVVEHQNSLSATLEAVTNPDTLQGALNSLPEQITNNSVKLEAKYDNGFSFGSGGVIYVQDLKKYPDKQVVYIATVDHIIPNSRTADNVHLGFSVSQPHGTYSAFIDKTHMGFQGHPDTDIGILAIVVDKGSHPFNPKKHCFSTDIEGKKLLGLGFTSTDNGKTFNIIPVEIDEFRYLIEPSGNIQLLEKDVYIGMSGTLIYSCKANGLTECAPVGNLSKVGVRCGVDRVLNPIKNCRNHAIISVHYLVVDYMNAAYAKIKSFD